MIITQENAEQYGCEHSHKNAEKCYECALKWLKQEADNG